MTVARMICMAMRDQCAVDGTPGVDKEIARRAVDSPIGEGKSRFACHAV